MIPYFKLLMTCYYVLQFVKITYHSCAVIILFVPSNWDFSESDESLSVVTIMIVEVDISTLFNRIPVDQACQLVII